MTAEDIYSISLPLYTWPTFNDQSSDRPRLGKDITLILGDCDALSSDQLESALDLTGSITTVNSQVYYHTMFGDFIHQTGVDTDLDFTPSVKFDLVNYRLGDILFDTQLLSVASSVITVK